MTTSKGPWIYDAESGLVLTKDTTGDWTANQGPRGVTTVCSVESLDGISNGDLIAAAPEMRDALRDAIDLISGDLTGVKWKEACHDFLLRARAALAKAER